MSVFTLEKLSQHVTEVLTLRHILDQLGLDWGRLIFFRDVSNLINRNNSLQCLHQLLGNVSIVHLL